MRPLASAMTPLAEHRIFTGFVKAFPTPPADSAMA
jgi:hypothetical protein